KKQGDDVTKAKDLADDVISTSKSMQKKLEDNAVEVSSVSDVSGDLEKEGKLLRNRITDLYNEGMDIVNLTQTVIDEGSFSNQTLVNKWEDELDELQDTDGDLWQAWNDSIAAKDKFINSSNKLTASVSTMLAAVEDAEEKKNEVIAELKNGLDMDMDELQDNLEDIDTAMTGILADISQIEVISAQNIVSPITTSIETVVAEKSQLDYLFPSLIVLLIMFISILLSSTLIIMEKNSKAYFRNFTTPTSDFVFILATFVTSIALMIVQILVVLVIAGIIFKTPFLQNFFSITLLIFLISSVFVLIGMAIGYMFNTEQTAMIGAISVGALILLTSDIILPIENMPVYVQNLARVSPFVMGSNTLRKVILFSAGFRDIKGGILGLSLTIVIISVLIFGIQQAMKAHFFAKFSRNRKSKILDRPENVNDIFKINDVIIKDEKELYRFIKRLHRHEFKKLVYRRTNRVADFAIEVLGDEKLSKKLLKMKTRWGVLKVIELYRPAQKTVEKKALVSKPEGEKTKTAKKNIAKKK
ncbi:ABC transporter permease, partial [Candidatus Woesearchaeota archaeon]|nr:ABC transporter permease [Candidatus Woesearchaeota archaeon]